MRAFALLLDRLSLTASRNAKLTLIEGFLRGTPDPDRGYALAALTGALSFDAAKPAFIRKAVEARMDAQLFAWSYDYVGDLAETVALLWPKSEDQPAEVDDGSLNLSAVIDRLHGVSRAAAPDAPLALVLHPNPKFGGTMNTLVVYSLFTTFQDAGCHVLRFNFRGVGRSAGEFTGGPGELADAQAAWAWLASASVATPSSARNRALPRTMRRPSTVPSAPRPVGESKSVTSLVAMARSFAASTIASASGCSEARSTEAASRSSSASSTSTTPARRCSPRSRTSCGAPRGTAAPCRPSLHPAARAPASR